MSIGEERFRDTPKILVIGASSYVGARLYSEFKVRGANCVGTYHTHQLLEELVRLDITSKSEVSEVISKVRPDIIVLASALSNQAAVLKSKEKANAINVSGCENVVRAATAACAKLVYLSSEAVFQDNDYGRTKLAAEALIKDLSANYLVLRLGMCFGRSPNTINDRPHNRLLKSLQQLSPVAFDSSLKFFPTELGHLSNAITALINLDLRNEILAVVAMPETDRYEIAKHVLPSEAEISESVGAALPPPPLNDYRLRELGIETLSKTKFLMTIKKDLGTPSDLSLF